MRVLMITGDKKFGPGHERFELQKSAVESLAVVYWGRGSYWPKVPTGQFDVVTTQDPFWRGIFGMWAAKQKRAKLNVQVHTDLSVYGGVKRALAQISLRHADSVRVVSEKIKHQVEKVGVKGKITVLPVFVDIARFRNVTRAAYQEKTILWMGRYEDEKDPLFALEVFAKVLQAGTEAKFVMIGQGSLKGELAKRAVGKPVEVHGWEDPLPYLAMADVVLCTSKHESWGASIVEALAAGVPVVAPDVGIAKEAGATILPKGELHTGVLEALHLKQRGKLQFSLYTKEQWVQAWTASLL